MAVPLTGNAPRMDEIVPGLYCWIREHPGIGRPVSSYFLAEDAVAVNPLLPEGGVEALQIMGGVDAIVLTNRHHVRDTDALIEHFAASLHVPEPGVEEVGRNAQGYRPADPVPGHGVAVEVGVLSPDEAAVHFPFIGALAVADGVMREGDGPLGFFADELLGDDPEAVKAGLREAFARIAERIAPEHLLLAHGPPIVGGATEALAAFARSGD